MAKINKGFSNLEKNYLFIEIAKRVNEYKANNPDKKLIRMGIGDVTRPLAPIVVDRMKIAAEELRHEETFRGYEDSGSGYDFLKRAIAGYYESNKIGIDESEVFINDGAKSDSGNIGDIFSKDNIVLLTDPVYPVYFDSNVMAQRKVLFLNSNEENNFAAMPDESIHADLIYLCSPNNPTGSAYTYDELKVWVDYALEHKAVIIFDSAYEAFITDMNVPRSIFAVEGARKCAIELCSLSKTAGFTGTRCGYTVIPKELVIYGENGEEISLKDTWTRRQNTKFNGVSYPVQRAAEAVFTKVGQEQTQDIIHYYMKNARTIMAAFDELGIKYTGGKNSPYIWFKCPNNMGSWEFFDYLMNEMNVIGTPGVGFGKNGEGWFRLTSFGSHENTLEAMERFKKIKEKL